MNEDPKTTTTPETQDTPKTADNNQTTHKKTIKTRKSLTITRTLFRVLVLATGILTLLGLYQYNYIRMLQIHHENTDQRAFFELADSIDHIDSYLSKAMVVNTSYQRNLISTSLWKEAAFAQSFLGQLPTTDTALDNTQRFLSQVGDYCYGLTKQTSEDENLSREQVDTLAQLSERATHLNAQIQDMKMKLYSGELKMKNIDGDIKNFFGEKKQEKPVSLNEVEKYFEDYPALIYDGPFSDHLSNKEIEWINDKPEVSVDQAKEVVQNFVTNGINQQVTGINHTGDGNGTIPTYNFQIVTNDQNRQINVLVTKKGGKALLMLDNFNPAETQISDEDAITSAKKFLDSKGFTNMEENYFQKHSNTMTINFAYKQGQVTMFPDLIKVKIALNDGSIIGFESRGYIMCHKENRELPSIKLSQSQIRQKVNSEMQIANINLAVIPLEGGKEVLCYEIRGTFKNKEYLIYINTSDGKEEKVLQLLVSPESTLTI